MEKMRASVFYGTNDIRVEKVERPRAIQPFTVLQQIYSSSSKHV